MCIIIGDVSVWIWEPIVGHSKLFDWFWVATEPERFGSGGTGTPASVEYMLAPKLGTHLSEG